MEGGKLLGTGSSSCVFSPNIPCKKNGKVSDERVSKLLYHEDSKKLSKYEKEQASLIKKIKGYKKWGIIYDEFCNAPDSNIVEKYDPEGYLHCFGDDATTPTPYIDAQLLNSDNGGNTLKSLFNDMFSYKGLQGKGEQEILDFFDTNFRKLMKMFYPLFLGLKEMNKHNIIHNDIKSINITGDKDELKYIDFGLTSKANNIKHFKKRSISEGNTRRLYYFYPLEYIYFYFDKYDLDFELTMNIKDRRNYGILKDIYYTMGYNIDEVCDNLYNKLFNSKYKIKDVIKKIDVYGLGIQVPLLFHEINMSSVFELNNPMINDFYILFRNMVNPDLNERLTAEQSYNTYMKLMKKHNISIKETKRTRRAARRATPRRATRRVTPRRAVRKRTTKRRV